MNVEHHIGAREDQIFVAAFERRAAEIGSRQLAILQHGAHGSIEHNDTSSKSVFESQSAMPPALLS